MPVIPTRRNVVVPLALSVLALGGVMAWLTWNSTRLVLAPIGPARVRPQIVCTAGTVIVLAPDGSLWGWGDNRQGQLGSHLPGLVRRPRRISADTNWTAVSVGYSRAAAVKADGTLWTWGSDGPLPAGGFQRVGGFQQVGDDRAWRAVGTGDSRPVAGLPLLALKTNGTLWAMDASGQATSGATPASTEMIQLGASSNWVAIPAGFYHSCGLQQDGSAWVLGTTPLKGGLSRLGGDTNWVAVRNGNGFALARKADGSWWARGPTVDALLDFPPGLSDTQWVCLPRTERWEVIAGGRYHVLGLTRNGAMRALGLNRLGYVGDGTTNSHARPIEIATDKAWIAVGAGGAFSVALAADGSLWTWGVRLGESFTRSKFIRTLGGWANRLGLRAAWADAKSPRFETRPRCILRFTTNAPAGPK